MAMRRIMETTWNDNILFSFLVELTYRCNLDCFFCYNNLGLEGRPLTDEQYFELFEDLAHLQVMNLTFTGGEPLSHPSFLKLGRKARDLGFVVRIKSNGHALRGRLAEDIRREVDPFLIEISLHGARAETHDRQTRVPGSFERLMSNLGELKALGQRVKLNATLTRWNEDEAEDMMALADGLGMLVTISPTVTPRDNGDMSPMSIAPTDEGIKKLYRLYDQRVSDAEEAATCTGTPALDKNCGAGAAGLAVDPYGSVYPCVQWRRPLGSLHEKSISEIWGQSPALAEIRRLNSAAKEQTLALGDEAFGMSHCMGLSEEKTGDPLAIDDEARRNARLVQEVRRERTLLPVIR
ncbi:MAG: radical SAM protein [Acidobacteriota bacterium]